MKPTNLPDRGRKLYHFLGKRGVSFICQGVAAGVALFSVEIAAAYSLQAFLVQLGVLNSNSSRIPRFIPHANLFQVLLFLLLVGIARGLLQWLQLYLAAAAQLYQSFMQRDRIMNWALHSQSANGGEIMHLISCADSVGTVVMALQTMATLLTSATLLFCGLITIAAVPTLTAVGLLGVLAACLRALDRRMSEAGQRMQRSTGVVYDRLLGNIKNLLLLQIYGTQAQEARHVKHGLDTAYGASLSYQRMLGAKFALPQMFGIFLICVMTLVATKASTLAPSVLVSFFYIFVRFVQNFSETSVQFSGILFHRAGFLKLADWWSAHGNEGSAEATLARAAFVPPSPLESAVGWNLSSVSFTYPGAHAPVLRNLNLRIDPGQTIVITGPSGAGKSTLVHLLLGGIAPSTGKIELLVGEERGAQALSSIQPRLLRSVGYVGPESFLIEGSIHQNLVYGLHSVPTDAEIKNALLAGECGFVYSLPKGLGHHITEQGQGLSAGQKQRLSLARALLRQPKVLILDEATSNLDAETEKRLVKTLAGLRGHMTIVGVTHRMALLEIADQRFELGAET